MTLSYWHHILDPEDKEEIFLQQLIISDCLFKSNSISNQRVREIHTSEAVRYDILETCGNWTEFLHCDLHIHIHDGTALCVHASSYKEEKQNVQYIENIYLWTSYKYELKMYIYILR